MSDLMALRAAVKAMLPTAWPGLPTAPPLHEGENRDEQPALPWLVINISNPDGALRSESAVRTAGRVIVTLTAAGRSEYEAAEIIHQAADALDGSAPVADGWSCGALIEHQPARIFPDSIDLPGPSVRGFAGVVAYRFVASPLPTSA